MWALRLTVVMLFFVCIRTSGSAPEPPISIFDNYRYISDIHISGNHHTRSITILTELTFEQGSYIKEKDLIPFTARARQNLLNTALFNFVDIEINFPDKYSVSFHIQVEERWYIWAFPVFEQEGRNFSDFLRLNDGSHFNYGLYFKHDNFRGRNETIKLRMLTGYKTQVAFEFLKPGFNRQSGWGFTANWLSFDQMPYNTQGDQQIFLKTIGTRLLSQLNLGVSYYYRHQLDHYHSIYLSYLDINTADTLLVNNPNFLPSNNNKSQTIDVGYEYRFDRRDSKVYPLNGLFLQFEFSRMGYSIDNGYEGFFHTQLISSYHTRLTNKIFANSRSTLLAINKKQVPYLFQTGLGYNEYMNGFEYRVIDGSSFGMIQNKLLYELIPRTERSIGWIPLNQFSRIHYSLYLKLHFDAGYVNNHYPVVANRMANTWLTGYGVGVDMVTFYDKVLSLNYSFNNFGEHGLFVHFNLAM